MKDQPAQTGSPPGMDSGTRLAFERTYLAHERTQMGWVRTALSLISFGFAIAKFFEWLREQHPSKETLFAPRTIGILMIASGIVSLLFSHWQHRRAIHLLRKQCPALPLSVAGVTSSFIGLLGLLALVAALIRTEFP